MQKEMSVKSTVLSILRIDSSKVITFERIHAGYTSNCYKLVHSSDKYPKELLVKEYIYNKDTNYEDSKHLESGMLIEYSALERMSEVKNPLVLTPTPILYSEEHSLIVESYIESTSFNQYLLKNSTIRPLRSSLVNNVNEISSFLAEFHGKYIIDHEITYLHGDLNPKNIRFTRDQRCFIIDPGSRVSTANGSFYYDLASFILCFFPYNPVLGILLGHQNLVKLRNLAVESYQQHTPQKFSIERLEETLLALLDARLTRKSTNKKSAYIKYQIMKFIDERNKKRITQKGI
jgi:tRNA A-37 threonylcarbamoyl transferase component Bud32